VINKIDSAGPEGIDTVRRNIAAVNPTAVVVDAASVLEWTTRPWFEARSPRR